MAEKAEPTNRETENRKVEELIRKVFFGKLKTDWLFKKPLTINEAKTLVYKYVWYFYPKIRPHALNNYLTPYMTAQLPH